MAPLTESGTFTDIGASVGFMVRPSNTCTLALTIANAETFSGLLAVESSKNGGQSWEPVLDANGDAIVMDGTDSALDDGDNLTVTLVNATNSKQWFRVFVSDAGEDDGISYLFTEVIGDLVGVLLADEKGNPLIARRDDGGMEFLQPVVINELLGLERRGTSEQVTTGAVDQVVDVGVYQTKVTTGGTQGVENLAVGDGTGVVIGTRKLIVLENLSDPSDVLTLDAANIVIEEIAAHALVDTDLSDVTMDAEGAFLMLEWNGAKWEVKHAGDCTLTPA
jgi:hypothetical protein